MLFACCGSTAVMLALIPEYRMPKDGAMTLNSSAMNRSDAILFAVVSSYVTRSIRICSRSVLGSSFLYQRLKSVEVGLSPRRSVPRRWQLIWSRPDAECRNNVVPADAVFQMRELRCFRRSRSTNARTVLFPEIEGYSYRNNFVLAHPVQQAR